MLKLFNRVARGACLGALAIGLRADAGDAQRLLDLPVRAWAGADATAPGAAAAFWNPAAAGDIAGRGEIMVLDVLAPDATGLGGFAIAGAWRLDPATTLALGYAHVGVDGILRTTDSPLVEDSTPLEIGEDGLSLAASRSVSRSIAAGVMVRYTRAAEIAADRAVVEFGAGVLLTPALPWSPRLGGGLRAETEGAAWTAGVEVLPIGDAESEWRLGASWNAEGSPMSIGVSHRTAALAAWRNAIELAAGVANEPGADGRTWQPVASATVRFSRYSLAALREEMANGFGAIHAVRFVVSF